MNEESLPVADLNDKLRSLRLGGQIDELIARYFKPQRQDTTWVTELGFEPLPFNEQGLGQFCTQALYSRNILQDRLQPNEPLVLDILRPIADQEGAFISKIESAPEPNNPDQFIVTIPVIPSEEVKAGGSGPIGILLRSAQPYDVSPRPTQEGTTGGRLLKLIATPPLAEQFLIEWDKENERFKVTSAEGEVRLIEPIVIKDVSPSTDEVNIILVQGSVVVCAQWDGYQGCLTVW